MVSQSRSGVSGSVKARSGQAALVRLSQVELSRGEADLV